MMFDNKNTITMALTFALVTYTPYMVLANEVEINNEENIENIEKIEVLGTRFSSQTANLYDIDDLSYQSLMSSLAQIPSIQVNLNSGSGSINEVYLRGSDPNYTLVTFNGIPLNDGTNNRGGVADLSLFDSFLINEIEVVNGAKSAVYGSQAVAGAINFVAKPTTGISYNHYQLYLGTDSIGGYNVGLSADFDNLLVKALTKEAGETYQGSQLNSQSLLLVATPELLDGQLELTLMTNKGDASNFRDDSGGSLYAVNRQLEKRDLDDINLGFKYLKSFTHFDWVSNAYYQNKQEKIDSPSVAPGIRDPYGYPASLTDNQLLSRHLSSFIRSHNDDVNWLIGVDYSQENAESSGIIDFEAFQLPTDFKQTRNTTGLFSEGNIQLTSNVKLNIAARYDHNDLENKFMPSISADWQISSQQALNLEWGKGFKLPSFYALSHPLIGNENLKSEHSQTWQLNYSYLQTLGTLNLGLFKYEFENLIDFDAGPPPQLVNRQNADSQGFEISFKSNETLNHWQWQSDYSYTNMTNSDGSQFLGRAKHKFNLFVDIKLPQYQVDLSVKWQYLRDFYGSSVPTGLVKLDDINSLNSVISWHSAHQVTLSVGLNNILDKTLIFTPGNPHTGRYIWSTINYPF